MNRAFSQNRMDESPSAGQFVRKRRYNIPSADDTMRPTAKARKRAAATLRQNRFYPLANHADMEIDIGPANVKKCKVPPIIITSDVNSIALINRAGLNGGFSQKNMSIGTKIHLDNSEDYLKFLELLTDENIEFYSHKSHEEKTFKAVLAGLYKNCNDEIKSDLVDIYNITPIKIVDMTANKINSRGSLYLVEFKKDEVTMKTLGAIKTIYHTVVSWKPYSPKYRGPTQCFRCGSYGHGQDYCNRRKTCVFCASDDHSANECPFKLRETVNPVVFRCFNCISAKKKDFNHRADDPICPSRQQYMEIRSRITQRTRRNAAQEPRPINKHKNEVRDEQNSFPALRPKVTYSQICAQKPVTRNVTSGDLYSVDELFDIFVSHVEQLERCNTRSDQLKVLASLLKYATKP